MGMGFLEALSGCFVALFFGRIAGFRVVLAVYLLFEICDRLCYCWRYRADETVVMAGDMERTRGAGSQFICFVGKRAHAGSDVGPFAAGCGRCANASDMGTREKLAYGRYHDTGQYGLSGSGTDDRYNGRGRYNYGFAIAFGFWFLVDYGSDVGRADIVYFAGDRIF